MSRSVTGNFKPDCFSLTPWGNLERSLCLPSPWTVAWWHRRARCILSIQKVLIFDICSSLYKAK